MGFCKMSRADDRGRPTLLGRSGKDGAGEGSKTDGAKGRWVRMGDEGVVQARSGMNRPGRIGFEDCYWQLGRPAVDRTSEGQALVDDGRNEARS
ncbi:hypothetical protein ACLOJK_038740 [Asimina triloba]